MDTTNDRSGMKDWQVADVRVLGRILAAQNIEFSLPDTTHLAEFFAETLLTIPGVAGCRICIEDVTIQKGASEMEMCADCLDLRQRAVADRMDRKTPIEFTCGFSGRPGTHTYTIRSLHHHFGYIRVGISDPQEFEIYHPFIGNLVSFIAISMENRWQRGLLQKAYAELEQKVDERTQDLQDINRQLQEEISTRRNAENALRDNERQITQLIQNSPIAMVVLTENEQVEWVNDKFVDLFGYTILDIPNVETWWPQAYPDEQYREEIKTAWNAQVQRVIREGTQSEPLEAMVVCKNGKRRHVDFRLSSIGMKKIVTFVDLTSRKQIEDELRERERNSMSLLRFSRNLERTQTYTEVLNAARDEVRAIIGYKNLWAYLLTEDKERAHALFASGPISDLITSDAGTAILTIKGDRMLEEIAQLKEVVVVEDARTDERTNKEIVALMGNRTIVNVPIMLFGRNLGSIGTGSFGEEGVRIPSPIEKEYLIALASHMAVSMDRISLQTARKQAEKELHLTNELLTTIINAAPTAIIGLDLEGRVKSVWNPAAERMLGWSAQEAFGNYLPSVPLDKEDEFREFLELIHSGKIITGIDVRRQKRDGTPIDYSIYAAPLHGLDGQINGKVAVLVDITERKRVEDELWRSSQMLKLVLDNMPSYVFWKDRSSVYLGCNVLFAANAGLKHPEEIAGLTDLDLPWKDAEAESYRTDDSMVMGTGIPKLNYEETQFTAEGIVTAVRTSKIPLRNPEGDIIGILGTFEDITERKQAEEKITQLNQDLERRVLERTAQLAAANKELEAFAYSVSHDLRAPLRHINGFLELLQKRNTSTLDEQSRHYMTNISDSARRMGNLIDDLLAFSRMSRQELYETQVNLAEMVEEILQEFGPETEGRNIVWHVAALPQVTGDRAMLRMVLVNLISNALKFTRPRSQAEIEIGWTIGPENEAVMYVRDNGVGFDMEYADKLFGVFQRLHRMDEFEGTGIGLANVHRIITRHGGKTWAESKVDQGATFYFSLPNLIS